jgi:hypothetical protein
MPGLSLQTEACVLLKRPPSEKFHHLTVFSAEHGTLTVMQRLAQKAAATGVALDLFDDAALALTSSNQGQTWFVQEARVLVRRSAIGRSYDALRPAVAFTTLVARNPVPQPKVAPRSRPCSGRRSMPLPRRRDPISSISKASTASRATKVSR